MLVIAFTFFKPSSRAPTVGAVLHDPAKGLAVDVCGEQCLSMAAVARSSDIK